MERIQNIKDTEQNIEHMAKVLSINKGYITYDDEEQVYLISALQELEIKKEVNFSQLLNYPLKFIKCHFLQSLLVYEKEFKENLIFDNVVFSKIINLSGNTFYRKAEFVNCKFESFSIAKCSFKEEAIFTSCIFRNHTSFYEVDFNSKVNFCSTSFLESVSFFKVNFLSPYTEENISGILSPKKIKLQAVFIGTFNNNFRHITANKSFSIQESAFNDKVDFSESTFNGNVNFCFVKFNGRAIFDKSNFFEALIFKKTTFKESNPSFLETNFTKTFQIEQKDLLYKYNDLKKINNYDELLSYRDLFRKLKSNRITYHNLIDASELHTQELYARELELKYKDKKTIKEHIEKWQLWFYHKLCDHHTDLLLNLKWLIIAIGLFTSLYFISRLIQDISILESLNPFGICFSIACAFIALILYWFGHIERLDFFASLNAVITLWVICYKPQLIFGIANLLGNIKYNGFENFLITIYTIVIGLIIFSLQKTARKNSIVPN